MTLTAGFFIAFWVLASVAVVGLAIAHRRMVGKRKPSGGHRRDSELHRRRAEAEAEIEEHDIGAMLDAIAERRRRSGRREIGEELADELLRERWRTSDEADR